MHRREQHRRERAEWVVCLTAVAQMVEGLPLLYRIVEAGEDDVRVELQIKSSAWTVLQIRPFDRDHVAVALSLHMDAGQASRLEPWMIKGIEAMDADLQWAASRSCSEQGGELLSALVRLRGTMLRGNGS